MSTRKLVCSKDVQPCLRESSFYSGGTILIDPVWGRCRVVHVCDDKLSFVIGDKPLNATADAWARIVGGKVLRWTDDREMRVEQEPTT